MNSEGGSKEEHIYTYMIILRKLIMSSDILLMVVLYVAGVNRIDIYRMIILILFVLFIVYPQKFRRNFIFLLFFMFIIIIGKHLFLVNADTIILYEDFHGWLNVLGFTTDYNPNAVIARSSLLNNNYLILLTAFIQHRLYTMEVTKKAFSEEQQQKDLETFATRYPTLTKGFTVILEVFQMFIPWITYGVFFIIAINNSKDLINLTLLFFNMLLLFWHISADLVTKVSHRRITRGWTAFTILAAICFFILITFQILSLDQVSKLGFIQDFITWIPTFVIDNIEIIGLVNYTSFTKFELAVKLLAYVAYFNLSVITKRQFERSAEKVKAYESNSLEPVHDDDNEDGFNISSISSQNKEVMEVQFSLVYMVHKTKKWWPIFDFIAYNTFNFICLVIVVLSLHWKLSVATAVYVLMMILYYILTPFYLQPKPKESGKKEKETLSVEELKTLWMHEDSHSVNCILSLRNRMVVLISFITILFVCALHISANFQILKRTNSENEILWRNMNYIAFFFGVNYQDQVGGNSYLHEIIGFLAILFLCAIDRKCQIWLTSKFGYEGSIYEGFEGKIQLEDYRPKAVKKALNLTPDLGIIQEEEESEKKIPKEENKEEEKKKDQDKENAKEELKEKYEKAKRDEVKSLISLEYRLFMAKVVRVLLFIVAVLLSLFTSFYKLNVWGIMVLIAVVILSFTKLQFNHLKWFTLVFSFVFLLQYLSSLANLNQRMSPSVYPEPFSDRRVERPISVPVYFFFGEPITASIVIDQRLANVPTAWAYYLGFIVTQESFLELWMDFFIMLFLNYFFLYFYSASYELDMNLNIKDTALQTILKNDESYQRSIRDSKFDFNESENYGTAKGSLNKSDSPDEEGSFNSKKLPVTSYEAGKYIKHLQENMIVSKFYNGVSTFIWATSSIICLICLLMVAFQLNGFINLFYILFCLWYLTKSVNFVYQKNWTFPVYFLRLLKPLVALEILLQFAFQIPIEALHSQVHGNMKWATAIGLVNLWEVNTVNYRPVFLDVTNIFLKWFMFIFILVQQNILECEEYEEFIKKTLAGIRSFSDRKLEAMAYLYNNQKFQVTIKNQYEKQKMTEKLKLVKKQVKKWNTTVFSKSTEPDQMKALEVPTKDKKESAPTEGKIIEIDEKFEDDHLGEGKDARPTLTFKELKEKVEEKKKRDDFMILEQERVNMDKTNLIKSLIDEKLGIIWKIWIYMTKKFTNQILLVFKFEKLNQIFDSVRDAEVTIHTDIEERAYNDFIADQKYMKEHNLETTFKIPSEKRSDSLDRATWFLKGLVAYYSLFLNIIFSNTEMFCYLFMIIGTIMNGSILSIVYPFSMFIYALLEEKRPSHKYWLFILYYTAIVLIMKFLFQVYPFSAALTFEFGSGVVKHSANNILRTMRIGLENVDASGRNFPKYFLFEAFILLSVTLHILVLVFGGVWNQREVEAESIKDAATRIAIAQKKARLAEDNSEDAESLNDLIDEEKTQKLSIPGAKNQENANIPRSYSADNCARMREVIQQICKSKNEEVDDERLKDCKDIEETYLYGGEEFGDALDFNWKDEYFAEIKNMRLDEFKQENPDWVKRIKESYDEDNLNLMPLSERTMTHYHFKKLEFDELEKFIIESRTKNIIAELYQKLMNALKKNKYFESLFPTTKEQKPGVDLYAPMVFVQVIMIVFLIFFYTKMDPDYTNFTSLDLTPTSFNKTMVLAVFLQIAIIVLDRYLYLSRDFVVIDKEEVDDDDDEESGDDEMSKTQSLSRFNTRKFDNLRSASASKLMVSTFDKPKKGQKEHKDQKEQEKGDEEPEDDGKHEESSEILKLSKTAFNTTLVTKFYLQLFLLIVIHAIVFLYFPIRTNLDLQNNAFWDFKDPTTGTECNEVFMNWTLVVFYLMYCFYFAVSAYQIRFGLPELRKGNFAMGGYSPINKAIFQTFLAVPFVFELKIFSDWSFTKTALDVFQWIKFETVYGDCFIAKCANKGYINHPLGDKIPWYMKLLIGIGGLIGIILVIAGPLLLFSSLNPLSQENPVLGASIKLEIAANITNEVGGATNRYTLFESDRFLSLGDIPPASFDTFTGERQITNLDRNLWQQVLFEPVSDSAWNLSPPSQTRLFERLTNLATDPVGIINLVFSYSFNRAQPADQPIATKELPIINIASQTVEGSKEIIAKLTKALNPNAPWDASTNAISFQVHDWLIPTIRLPAAIKPKLIFSDKLKQNITISRKCSVNQATQATSFWWEMTQSYYDLKGPIEDHKENKGIIFFTWSEKVSGSLTFGLGIVAFYTVVVLAIGRFLRSFLSANSSEIFIKDMPKPDSLILICEGILISRLENNLDREEQLYFILIDIMRSPEILKMITTSSLKNNDQRQIQN